MDILQFLDWGIAGVLAVIIFIAYRNLVKQIRDDRKYMEDRQKNLLDSYNTAMTENTKILAELFTWLKAKNGHKYDNSRLRSPREPIIGH